MVWFILISLLILGVILVLVEVLFVPGTTLVGVLGVIVTGVGIYYGFINFETGTALTISGLAVLANVLVIVYGFKSGVWDKFSLKDTITSRSFDDRLLGLEVGQKGRTVSDFRPYGKVVIGDKIYEAKSEAGFLSTGTEVYIEKLEDNRIIINKQ
jgi:membrane-bound ClpP family serine protease